jgi:hypothetical protein
MGQQLNTKLKAFVRYDGNGRVIPGTLILQRFKPKVGDWKEIPSTECCGNITTTSTTTTAAPTVFGMYYDTNLNTLCAHNNGGPVTLSTGSNIIVGTTIVYDGGSPIHFGQEVMFITIPTLGGQTYGIIGDNAVIASLEPVNCNTTTTTSTSSTTTTTTTAAPTVYELNGSYGGESIGEACYGPGVTFYSTTPLGSVTNGSVLYDDSALTTPTSYPYVALPERGIGFSCSNGVLSNQSNC